MLLSVMQGILLSVLRYTRKIKYLGRKVQISYMYLKKKIPRYGNFIFIFDIKFQNKLHFDKMTSLILF